MRSWLLVALASAGLAACAAPGPTPAAAQPADGPGRAAARITTPAPPAAPTSAARARPELALPFGWSTLRAAAFEEALARWNPLSLPGALDATSLDELARALDGPSDVALRAVLLLAASGAPEGHRLLLARLERRVRAVDATFPAVDVAAAAALERAALSEADLSALATLVRGRRPHPRLAVSVECGATLLAHGRDEAIAFLASVLLEGTPGQAARPPWTRGGEPIEALVLAQWRASEALARRAGIQNPYRPEAAAAERARAAAEIELALARPETYQRP